ncbi:MAG: hypothetical protein Q3978_02900 [Limosilactobacillus gorillae]|uniref:hypothetical protein n=1 Tax=Limosilactobacillus gorillae TaxID=1450649 RepID=UPI000B20C619|nr:hypothetical protein [Limosilactobacillus gorillae]MDO4855494.1 hypothetical protein [Limosilactobacillus gorillae]
MSNSQIVSTATDKVRALSASLKDGLLMGKRYVDLLNELVETNELLDLLSSTKELVNLNLVNAFVKFPQHYQPADYYLLFMSRMLELNAVNGMTISQHDHALQANITPLEEGLVFKFEPANDHAGAFFADQRHHEPLFYIDLENRLLNFSNQALVNFFIVKQVNNYNDLDLEESLAPLIAFANLLKAKLDFTIDLGILSTSNDTLFHLQKPDLDVAVIDKLFISTTETDYYLMSLPQNNGAQLNMDRGIKLQLSYDLDDYSQQWSFRVLDEKERSSFLGVLLHYPIVRDWYLENREDLAIQATHLAPQLVKQPKAEEEPKEDA